MILSARQSLVFQLAVVFSKLLDSLFQRQVLPLMAFHRHLEFGYRALKFDFSWRRVYRFRGCLHWSRFGRCSGRIWGLPLVERFHDQGDIEACAEQHPGVQ